MYAFPNTFFLIFFQEPELERPDLGDRRRLAVHARAQTARLRPQPERGGMRSGGGAVGAKGPEIHVSMVLTTIP